MWNLEFKINSRPISINFPTYFIADIAANHDGELQRAKDLVWLAKKAGADCAKFQHFKAEKIVSSHGFSSKIAKVSHQEDWKKSVVEIYDQYHTRREWTTELVSECKKANIDFMTTPYDIEAINELDQYLNAYKIGSGDITNPEILDAVSECNKPIFLATGASSLEECVIAASRILSKNPRLCMMQCNTNYTGKIENFSYVNLKVLNQFANIWPGMPLGLSDHTPGHSAVLGAVSLGARVIEKHFTDDNSRVGPDHKFALDAEAWSRMVYATRELEKALGDGIKCVEKNELETVVIQRRAIRLVRDMQVGEVLNEEDLIMLRPCPNDAISPMSYLTVLGRKLTLSINEGDYLTWSHLK